MVNYIKKDSVLMSVHIRPYERTGKTIEACLGELRETFAVEAAVS